MKNERPSCREGCLLLKNCQKLCQPGTCYALYWPAPYWADLINSGWNASSGGDDQPDEEQTRRDQVCNKVIDKIA